MKYFALIFVFIIGLSGCVTQSRCDRKFPPVTSSQAKDTSGVVSTEVIQDKDSASFIPADSSWIKMYLECSASGEVLIKELNSYKGGKNMGIPEVSVKNNVLTAKCKVDSLEVYNRISSHYKAKVEYRDRTRTETKTVRINYLTPFQRLRANLFWVLVPLCLILSFLLLKTRLL